MEALFGLNASALPFAITSISTLYTLRRTWKKRFYAFTADSPDDPEVLVWQPAADHFPQRRIDYSILMRTTCVRVASMCKLNEDG